MLARIVLAAALAFAAAPAWAIAVGCATPSSNTTYYAPTMQSCGGASVLVSDTLTGEWTAGTSSSHACSAYAAGMIRYQDGLMQFCDGTAWRELYSSVSTGITAASADRITSGTTSLVVVSATGYVSLTQAGVNTGWFDPSRGLVTLGVSATGPISATNAYFTGTVYGAGTATFGAGSTYSQFNGGTARISSNNAGTTIFQINGFGGADPFALFAGASTELIRVKNSGNVGIGTTAPAATLQVSGSFIVSQTGQTTTPSLYVGSNGSVGVGTSAPSGALQVTGSGDPSVNIVALNVGLAYHAPSTSARQYGIKVSQLGGRYAQQSGINVTLPFTNGEYYVGTSYGVESYVPVSSQAYQQGVAIYGEISNTALNYGTGGSAVKGVADSASVNGGSIIANGQGVYGGNFTAYGKGNAVGVYADAYLSASPVSGAVAIPLKVASNGTELMRVTDNGRVGINTTAPSATLSVSGSMILGVYAAAPVACTSAYTGMTANAQHGGYPCYCNGSYWSPAGDISTACNW